MPSRLPFCLLSFCTTSERVREADTTSPTPCSCYCLLPWRTGSNIEKRKGKGAHAPLQILIAPVMTFAPHMQLTPELWPTINHSWLSPSNNVFPMDRYRSLSSHRKPHSGPKQRTCNLPSRDLSFVDPLFLVLSAFLGRHSSMLPMLDFWKRNSCESIQVEPNYLQVLYPQIWVNVGPLDPCWASVGATWSRRRRPGLFSVKIESDF